MTKVITYGTFDLLHHGHVRLLERAKELGDYLIVGITSDNYDRFRGKINVNQTLIERVEAVRNLGIADKIIVEEYEGQKIDDIRRYDIDIFTVGSDWVGYFDYLNEYCKVVYLDRTEGVSSSSIRSSMKKLTMGIVGDDQYLQKFYRESKYVNGLNIESALTRNTDAVAFEGVKFAKDYDELLAGVEAVYIHEYPEIHYSMIKKALEQKKHVLCEAPITVNVDQYLKLCEIARKNDCLLMDGIRTAFATAYERLRLILKSGIIGDIKMIDVTCTSLREYKDGTTDKWNSICAWGPNAMLPIFQLLGTDYVSKNMVCKVSEEDPDYDVMTKIDFVYKNAVATVKVGQGIKSEGELIISGTRGYAYVPAPWWKTEYFEIRYEDQSLNKRYYFQLEGEGIRNELVAFKDKVMSRNDYRGIEPDVSRAFISVVQDFYDKKNVTLIE